MHLVSDLHSLLVVYSFDLIDYQLHLALDFHSPLANPFDLIDYQAHLLSLQIL